MLVPPGVDAGAGAGANANGDDANAVFRVPVEVQQQLQSERARNEEMAADLRALMDRFVRLKNEQVLSHVRPCCIFWGACCILGCLLYLGVPAVSWGLSFVLDFLVLMDRFVRLKNEQVLSFVLCATLLYLGGAFCA